MLSLARGWGEARVGTNWGEGDVLLRKYETVRGDRPRFGWVVLNDIDISHELPWIHMQNPATLETEVI